MDLGIEGRPALVAAASRGLGYACARALAREGARVAICSRDAEAVGAARDALARETGAQVHAVVADVSEADGVARFVRGGVEALGGCQILVANAGGPPASGAIAASDGAWLQALELNFLSVVRMCREALPPMREAGYGRIVAITSHAVREIDPALAVSTAVRLATTGFLKGLSVEVAGEGITVNSVQPGTILTGRTRELARARGATTEAEVEERLSAQAAGIPGGRLGDPEELGDLVAFLASTRAAYLTGQAILLDGGRYRGIL